MADTDTLNTLSEAPAVIAPTAEQWAAKLQSGDSLAPATVTFHGVQQLAGGQITGTAQLSADQITGAAQLDAYEARAVAGAPAPTLEERIAALENSLRGIKSDLGGFMQQAAEKLAVVADEMAGEAPGFMDEVGARLGALEARIESAIKGAHW